MLFDETTGELCGVTLIGLSVLSDEHGRATIILPSPPQEVPVASADLKRLVTA